MPRPAGVSPPVAMQTVYADLHIHLGRAGEPAGPVKITAARDLTLANILTHARERKGITLIGVIDAATSGGLHDLERLVAAGELHDQPGGGLRYRDAVTLIPGAEVEVLHGSRPVHLLCYLPDFASLRAFGRWQRGRVKNGSLSTQRHHQTTADQVVATVGELGGVVIPAHIFTPFKSALGAAGAIGQIIDPDLWCHVPAVELGLSSDTELAAALPELAAFTYLTNSDAHSLAKIGREYNHLLLAEPTFADWVKALRGQDGRRVLANYGLDPRLGKYHRTYCLDCDRRIEGEPPVLRCPDEPAHAIVLGVLDRIWQVGAWQRAQLAPATPPPGCPAAPWRPPYVHQVPLQFVPGLGPRALGRLLDAFGTEMGVLHQATAADLVAVVGPKLARLVVAAREGSLAIAPGAGGIYGKVLDT